MMDAPPEAGMQHGAPTVETRPYIGSIAGSKSMFKGWTDEDQEMFEKLTDPREKQQFINYIIKLKREGKRPMTPEEKEKYDKSWSAVVDQSFDSIEKDRIKNPQKYVEEDPNKKYRRYFADRYEREQQKRNVNKKD